MKAFRADLQQKSFNARKTNNYEDRLNVTYKGMVSENSEEHYKTLAENLEKSLNILTRKLNEAHYKSIQHNFHKALQGRSNLNEMGGNVVSSVNVNNTPELMSYVNNLQVSTTPPNQANDAPLPPIPAGGVPQRRADETQEEYQKRWTEYMRILELYKKARKQPKKNT